MKALLGVICGLAFAATGSAAGGGEPLEKRVALIFDDGPVPEQGAALQALLTQEKVPVNFAHVGRNVQAHPGITVAAHRAGHEIINHSQTHARIGELDTAAVTAQVAEAKAAITTALGEPPRWYWPPFLSVDERLLAAIETERLSLYVPHHLVDSRDWDLGVSAEEIVRRATTGVRDGSVILFHEWRDDTLAQLPVILAELRQQGCRFHTFTALAESLAARRPAQPADPKTQAAFAPRAAAE